MKDVAVTGLESYVSLQPVALDALNLMGVRGLEMNKICNQ